MISSKSTLWKCSAIRRNHNLIRKIKKISRVQFPGEELFFSDKEENEERENQSDPAQKTNTGDRGDKDGFEETKRGESRGNDNSGAATGLGSASTNSQ